MILITVNYSKRWGNRNKVINCGVIKLNMLNNIALSYDAESM